MEIKIFPVFKDKGKYIDAHNNLIGYLTCCGTFDFYDFYDVDDREIEFETEIVISLATTSKTGI